MATLASSSPVLGMQWAGPGSSDAAVSLLVAAGVAVDDVKMRAGGGGSGGQGVATGDCYMADAEVSLVKAKVFFEQWGEDKGTSLG